MVYEAIKNDFRSSNIVVTTPFKDDDSEIHIEMAHRMRHIVSGQEGTA